MKIEVVTYGLGDAFAPEKFKPIKNRPHVKPEGGLWASPINAEWGWKQWCEAENYGNLSSSFTYFVDGEIMVIDNLADLHKMPWVIFYETLHYPDYEATSKKFDAIYLTENGQQATRFSYPQSLYGWDCECLLIMNPHAVAIPHPAP